MKKLGVLIACLLLAGAASAQTEEDQAETTYSESAADTGAAEDSGGADAMAEQAAADAAATEDAAAADGAADDSAAPESPAEGAGAGEMAADDATADAGTEDAAADAMPAEATDDASGEAASGNSMSELMEQTADEPVGAGEASETAGDDSGSAAEAPTAEPTQFYVGADYVWTTASLSKPALKAAFGGDELDSSMYRVRAGMRLFERMGLELHYGTGDTDIDELESDEYRTDQFYGVYLVPTGVLLDLVEVGAAIGYAHTDLERANASEGLGGVSFGVNFELPLYTGDELELRVGGGGTVYRAQNSARVYGYHAGVRIDFKI